MIFLETTKNSSFQAFFFKSVTNGYKLLKVIL